MDKPKITINGKEIELGQIKARLWKEIIKFHEGRRNIETADLMEKYCEIIALAFGVTTDEVLDNLNIEDVGELYYDIFDAVAAMLKGKSPKKNKEAEEQT